MALVDILNVTVEKPAKEHLYGSYIDVPTSGSESEVYSFNIVGWVLGRNSQAVAIELVHDEAVYRRAPVRFDRPDITAAFPGVPGSGSCGFRATVSVLGLPAEFEVSVEALLQDGTRVTLGVISGRRRPLQTVVQPRLQPIMLTTYGRTGSTWVMRLLGTHPQIVAYRPFEYEPRVGSYWAKILKEVSEPASYAQSLATELSNQYWWLGDKISSPEVVIPDMQMHQLLGRTNVEALAVCCQARVDELYSQVAASQDRRDAVYFAEKQSPDYYERAMVHELYPGAREIVLIRDFRDMVCSILAFNAKRGYQAFGRELVKSDEDFVRWLRPYTLNLLKSYRKRSWPVHLLRYEDLILRPRETLTDIFEYLDLDRGLATVEGILERASQEVPEMQHHLTSRDYRRSIGRWRHDLSAPLQALCQEAFGDVLKEFGYSLE